MQGPLMFECSMSFFSMSREGSIECRNWWPIFITSSCDNGVVVKSLMER